MNLLPKTHEEFVEKDYWNKFFKKRGNKAFEWYGEYLELCTHLHKYIKAKDIVLIPGCGNSRLSADLYDAGFSNIVNIDLSEVVIKQMTKVNEARSSMKFLCMDALNMTFADDDFTVVLDKGTLDALMPDDSIESNERVDKYFSEIKRVLKLGGRFICISLLQSHILHKLLSSFCDKSWMFRVVRCHEAEQKNAEEGDGNTLPVFVVVATKFKMMPQLILELCLAGDRMSRLAGAAELAAAVASAQHAAFVTNGLARTALDDDDKEVSLDLHRPGDADSAGPRYTVHVLQRRGRADLKYAVFVVPQGRETEWLFGAAAGRRRLLQAARCGRLAVAALRRGHSFASLDAVREELADVARMLTPPGFDGQIPFLSVGGSVGRRAAVGGGRSARSGPYAVEDVCVDGAPLRRLVFLDNQALVQSEARLRPANSKNKQRVDFGHISTYHAYMCVGVQLAHSAPTPELPATRLAVLGLGGGGLCMFVRRCCPPASVVAVEIDPEMLDVAQKHFDLRLDEKLEVRIQDGDDFLKEAEEKDERYSALLLDMDSKDRSLGLSCPPPQFLADAAMRRAARILRDDGHLILNLVCRDAAIRASTLTCLRAHFAHVAGASLSEDVNEVILATNGPGYEGRLEPAVKALNAAARERNLVKLRCVDLKEFLESLEIVC